MGIRITDLADQTATIDFEFRDDTIEVTYRPNYITGEVETALTAATTGAQAAAQRGDIEGANAATDEVLHLMSNLIVKWDIFVDDDETERLGTDPEAMAQLPSVLVSKLFSDIREDLVGKAKGKPSSGGGRPKERGPRGTAGNRRDG